MPSVSACVLPVAASGAMRSSTLSRCSSATPSVVNGRSKPSTSACNPLPLASWLSSHESSCPHALRLVAFLPASPRRRSKPCVRSFLKMGWRARWVKSGRQADLLIEQAESESSSTLMARARPPANVPCQRPGSCLHPSGGWVRCVLPATPGASAGRSSVPARPSRKRIPLSGSARSPTLATESFGKNCAVQWLPSSATVRPMTRPVERVLLRLDGQYGTGGVLADLAGFSYVMRGKDYTVLDPTEVQSRLHLPPDQQFSRPESDLVRALYDCPDVPVGPTGQRCRVVVATHPASEKKSRVGLTRSGLVYELFFTNLPQGAFTAADVVALYLHRGAFEPVLADEDQEQDPDRWCSHAPWGQEAWQIISQWVWNLRLELGHQLEPTPMRTTEFAPASQAKEQQAPSSGYGPPTLAAPWKAGRLSGRDFVLQPDGTLRSPANQALSATEQRREADGSLRLVYAARLSQCRPCPRRVQCQWHGRTTTKPRRVSLLLHPLPVGSTPLLVARIGVADSIAEPAWACCATNGLRSLFRRPRLPSHTTR